MGCLDQADGMCAATLVASPLINGLYKQKEDAFRLWGHPTTPTEVATLFSRFCSGELAALPWSDQPPASETSVISKQLAEMNKLGFLTINSQPAVNGIRSDDKVFGWGPSNGYVYQKVCSVIPAG